MALIKPTFNYHFDYASIIPDLIMRTISTRLSILTKHIAFSQSQLVLTSSHKDFMKIILNRPKALNSLNLQMVNEIIKQLPKLQTSKAFWIEGTGGKAFCAGGDVKSLVEEGSTISLRQNFFKNEYTMDYRLSQLKSLQISNWDGIVMGGGAGVSGFAPFILATQRTVFAMPECKIGFFPDVGAGYFLSKLRNNLGFYLGLTGARLKGEEVVAAGLATHFLNSNDISAVYKEIQQSIGQTNDPRKCISQIIKKYHKQPLQKQLKIQKEIKQLFSLPTVSAIYEKAKSTNQEIAKTLQDQCPLSVYVTHELIQRAKKLSIRQCFIQDHIIAGHFLQNANFVEGVNCLLIQKRNNPKWTHKHLLDVKTSEVEAFFMPKQGSSPLGI